MPSGRASPVRAEATVGVARDVSRAAASVLGTLSVVQRALATDPPQLSVARLRAHVEAAIRDAEHAELLAKELGVYAGDAPYTSGTTSAREALTTALLLVGPRIDHRGHVRFTGAEDAFVSGRAAPLVRVFVNVLAALVEASPDPSAPHDIEVEMARQGDELQVVVTDTSSTWPPPVGDARSSRDRTRHAALQGLSSARALLGSLGGHLSIDPDGSGGTTVMMLLPTIEAEAPPRSA